MTTKDSVFPWIVLAIVIVLLLAMILASPPAPQPTNAGVEEIFSAPNEDGTYQYNVYRFIDEPTGLVCVFALPDGGIDCEFPNMRNPYPPQVPQTSGDTLLILAVLGLVALLSWLVIPALF